jgi:Predicted glycosyltransferases
MIQSIIVTFHKNKDMLMYCLKRLVETTPENIEIIIVGNNVNHTELDFEINLPKCTYHKICENIQYPKAINYGVAQSKGEIITFVDADIFVMEHWYDALLKCFLSSPQVGAVSAKLINPLNQRILDFGIMYSRFNSAHTLMGAKYDHPLAMKDRKVQAFCSAILMTKKSVFNNIGGLDEEIPYAYTDCDYCIRLTEHGYENWVAAQACAYHKGGTSQVNSKTNFSYYHSDAKGIFAMKDYLKLQYDLEKWYSKACHYARMTYNNIAAKYFLIDMSTMYDRHSYYDMISQYLNIEYLDIIEQPNTSRDSQHIVLHDKISYNYIDLASPILYFVDTFTSLFDNSLWYSLRYIKKDLIIDRHGNIVPVINMLNGSY